MRGFTSTDICASGRDWRAASPGLAKALWSDLALAGPLLPRRWRLNPPEQIARVLLEAALNAKYGVHVVAIGANGLMCLDGDSLPGHLLRTRL